jgi:hypothetical protein
LSHRLLANTVHQVCILSHRLLPIQFIRWFVFCLTVAIPLVLLINKWNRSLLIYSADLLHRIRL